MSDGNDFPLKCVLKTGSVVLFYQDTPKELKECSKKAAIAVAGGISSKTIEKYVALNPEIVIVGSAIGNAEDPVAEAKSIKEALV